MLVPPGSVTGPGNGALPPTEKNEGRPNGKGGRKKGQGRMDSDRQPAVKKPEVIAKRLDELVDLHNKAQLAGERAKDAITKAAEDSGFLASAVRKLVTAKAGDKFEEKHREVEQQAELFDEAAK